MYHTYLDAEGKTVLYHECEPVAIGAGETVELPFLAPAEGETWEKHNVSWSYEIAKAVTE